MKLWLLLFVMSMPQGVTSQVLPFSDVQACNAAQAMMAKDFKLIISKGAWVLMDCISVTSKSGLPL